MPDMLVKLYQVEERTELTQRLRDQGITIRRALAPDKQSVLEYIREHFSQGWQCECDCTFGRQPIGTFIAVKDKKVVGFACYDATAKGFFGPTGVTEALQGQGIGTALLLRTLVSMREEGYGYAIIGWVGPARFYEKTVGATVIEDSFPGVYSRLISQS